MKHKDKIILTGGILFLLSPLILWFLIGILYSFLPPNYDDVNNVLEQINYTEAGPIQEEKEWKDGGSPAHSVLYSNTSSGETLRSRILRLPNAKCETASEGKSLSCLVGGGVYVSLNIKSASSYLYLAGETK